MLKSSVLTDASLWKEMILKTCSPVAMSHQEELVEISFLDITNLPIQPTERMPFISNSIFHLKHFWISALSNCHQTKLSQLVSQKPELKPITKSMVARTQAPQQDT
jgi:hypothetical protein